MDMQLLKAQLMKSLVYDIETFPNIFTCYFSNGFLFEISWRKNETIDLIQFIYTLDEMIGFNNVMFDYPVIHFIIENQQHITSEMIFKKATQIIETPFNQRYSNIIWDDQRHVKQIDLYMMHHFDNTAKSTSLKALQIVMHSDSVEDLPFEIGQYLLSNEIDRLIKYNQHDVDETLKFWEKSKENINFRRQICIDTKTDVMNFNDTKIGKKYFENELEKLNPGCCYGRDGKRQTPRRAPFIFGELESSYNNNLPVEFHLPPEPTIEDFIDRNLIQPNQNEFSIKKKFKAAMKRYKDFKSREQLKFEKALENWPKKCLEKHKRNLDAVWIPVKPILFNYIQFNSPEFQNILKWYQTMNITQTKGGFSNSCTINNFTFHFGAGGIHGSISGGTVRSNKSYVIRDIDVASYYPNLSIKNKLYPEHLGLEFCRIYEEVFQKRKKHKKGTAGNAVLKLALNGVYGDSNNPYSPFFDPQYTMSITINGQLLLAMLAEALMTSPDIELIQINTDGLTIRHQRYLTDWIEEIEKWWMELTKLELENVNYQTIFIRDVNNYIGWYKDGELKRKGVYEYEREWHQDQSGLVIQKAVEAYLTKNTNIEQFIQNHDNIFDFMMRGKVNSTDRLVLVQNSHEIDQQKIIRFYFSKTGGELIKYMPPLKNKPNKIRRNAYQGSKGWKVKVCNHINQFKNDIDYDYYIKEAYKLIEPLKV